MEWIVQTALCEQALTVILHNPFRMAELLQILKQLVAGILTPYKKEITAL